jgi:hypothetical protein
LNNDVLGLILDRFDIKTLTNLRLVSKQWKDVISNNLPSRVIYTIDNSKLSKIFSNFIPILYKINESEYYSEDGDYIHEISYTIGDNDILHRENGPAIIRRFLVDEDINSYCPYIEEYWYKNNQYLFMHKTLS